jgi:hypothetical protein
MNNRLRPGLVVGASFAGVLLLGVAAFLSHISHKPPGALLPEGTTNSGPEVVSRESTDDRSITAGTATVRLTNTTPTAATQPDATAHDQYVRKRIAELEALSMKDDVVSRDIILSELRNSDRDIRKGALEAAIQFSDRSVIPRLEEVAAQTEDAAEKAEILEAIEYIKLPSLTEFLEQQKAHAKPATLTNGS